LYGKALIDRLATTLSDRGLRGVSPTNLRKFRAFYEAFPEIQQTVSVESGASATLPHIPHPTSNRQPPTASVWSVRELERQIGSGLYARLAPFALLLRRRVTFLSEATRWGDAIVAQYSIAEPMKPGSL